MHGTIWTNVEPGVPDISITINHVDDVQSGLTKLGDEKLTVVCAPDYRVGGQPLEEPEQLPHADLIHIPGRPACWDRAANIFGLADMPLSGGCQTNSSNLALELASNGLG